MILNTTDTNELMINRRKEIGIRSIFISGECVERVSGFWICDVHIKGDLTWSTDRKQAQQRLHFLRISRKNQHI